MNTTQWFVIVGIVLLFSTITWFITRPVSMPKQRRLAKVAEPPKPVLPKVTVTIGSPAVTPTVDRRPRVDEVTGAVWSLHQQRPTAETIWCMLRRTYPNLTLRMVRRSLNRAVKQNLLNSQLPHAQSSRHAELRYSLAR